MRGNRLFKYIDKYIGIPLIYIFGAFTKKSSSEADLLKYHPDKILLIKLSAMGDTILMVPAIRAIRQQYPQAVIKMIVTHINQEIVRDCPYLNNTIMLDLAEYTKKPWRFIRFIRDLKTEKFDLALDFDQWLRISPLLAFFSHSPYRLGFKTEGQHRHWLYTHSIAHSTTKHEVECFLDLVRCLGISGENTVLELWLNRGAEDEVQKRLKSYGVGEDEILVLIHPGCGEHGRPRQWPEKKYQELIRRLQGREKIKIILTGGNSERNLIEQICRGLEEIPIVSAGWKLEEIIALVKKGKVLISGNTGIMHISAAVGTPVVALHGPTNPQKWGPCDSQSAVIMAKTPCSPCLYLGFEYGCKDYPCMETIEVEEVFQAIMKYIET